MGWDCQRCDIGVDPGKNYCDDCWAEIETEQAVRPIVREAISRFAAKLAEELRKEITEAPYEAVRAAPIAIAMLGKVAAAAERAAKEEDPE